MVFPKMTFRNIQVYHAKFASNLNGTSIPECKSNAE